MSDFINIYLDLATFETRTPAVNPCQSDFLKCEEGGMSYENPAKDREDIKQEEILNYKEEISLDSLDRYDLTLLKYVEKLFLW